jgi:predicted O-methyltransferase YrrM
LTDIVDAAVEAYTEAHTSPQQPQLKAVTERTKASLDAPGMMVGTVEGRFLEMLVHALGARNVLEIGTYSGYSSIAMAAGLAPGGRITTCEVYPLHVEHARSNIAASGYSDRIEVLEGRATETIARLDGPFDFVFIDADKAGYLSYFEAVLPKLAPRGLIAADNTLWSGRVLDEADQSEDTVAIRRFNDAVAADTRVVCVQLSVRDGVTLIRHAPGQG